MERTCRLHADAKRLEPTHLANLFSFLDLRRNQVGRFSFQSATQSIFHMPRVPESLQPWSGQLAAKVGDRVAMGI